MANMELNQACF